MVWVGHWSQNLSPNICSIVGDKNQLKRRNLWRHQNISTSNWESGIIRWIQLAGCPVYAENIIIPVIGNICCAWQTHSEIAGSIGRNMLKMVSIWSCFFTQYPLIEGVQPKTMRKWANNSLTLWPYIYSCSCNVLHVSGITKHPYGTNIWQYGSWWNQEKLDKLSIVCSQITQKRN